VTVTAQLVPLASVSGVAIIGSVVTLAILLMVTLLRMDK
jgi:hypothetical protein